MANEYRVSSFALEVLDNGAAQARVSQYAVEVLHAGAAQARVSQFSIEVLRSVTSTSSGRRRQIINN